MSAVLEAREPSAWYLEAVQPALVRQFELLATAPDAVTQLRELILALAVQGKLVRQDARDETASDLLERIAGERTRLIAAGKLRKSKDSTEDDASEPPYSLPQGWAWSKLAVIGVINPRNDAADDVVASFVQMSSIPVAFNDPHATEARSWRDIKSGFTQFAEGDVGVAKITPCFENGKSTVFQNLSNGIGAGTTELHIVRPLCGIAPRYVLLFLKSPRFLYEGEATMTGTAGQKRLPRSFFENCPFPLPPLAEQARIVARVDELMRLCDALEAKGRLEAEQHARLLGTLLGTLTDSSTPDELAANWQRVADHFDLLLDRPEAVDGLEQTILQLAVRGLLVPRGHWTRSRFGDVVAMLNGYAFKSEWFIPSGVRLVRNVNVSHGSIDWHPAACVSAAVAEEFAQFALAKGDVLLTLDRPIISTGLKLAVVEAHDLPCLLLQRVARLSPDASALARDFMLLWLRSDSFMKAIDPGRSNGVPHISTKQVAALPIDLPSLAEQAIIVARVTELRRHCSDLRRCLSTNRSAQSHLARALVSEVA